MPRCCGGPRSKCSGLEEFTSVGLRVSGSYDSGDMHARLHAI